MMNSSREFKETGLIGGCEKRSVEIHEYSESWPRLFELNARRIREALGGVALQIEHIGSTSVPGLAAKPIIDILLIIKHPEDEETYLPALIEAGYELRVREPDLDQHRMVRTHDRNVHVHIFPPESKEVDRYIAFRDQLRSNADDKAVYEAAKRLLASRDWDNMNDYADAKTAVVEPIIVKGLSLCSKYIG